MVDKYWGNPHVCSNKKICSPLIMKIFTTRNSAFAYELNSSQIACFSSQMVYVTKQVNKLFLQQRVVKKSPLVTKFLFRHLQWLFYNKIYFVTYNECFMIKISSSIWHFFCHQLFISSQIVAEKLMCEQHSWGKTSVTYCGYFMMKFISSPKVIILWQNISSPF